MSENDEMTCAELADVAAELALGVLTGRERAMAVGHLDNCDACREDVRQLMATGEQLLELLPPAEPSAGFETRVLARLGFPAPPPEYARSRQFAGYGGSPRHRRPAQDGTRPGDGRPGGEAPGGGRPRGGRPRGDQPRGDQPRGDQPRGDQHSGTRRPRWTRRALAAASVALAVIVAGFGGWRIGVSSGSAAARQVTSASLLTATHHSVGNVFLYSGTPRWLYMAIDMESGNGPVICELVGANGHLTTLGSFRLADGYGEWGSPDPGDVKNVVGARVVSATGTVLATASFPDW